MVGLRCCIHNLPPKHNIYSCLTRLASPPRVDHLILWTAYITLLQWPVHSGKDIIYYWGPCRSVWHVGMLVCTAVRPSGPCSVGCVVLLLPISTSSLKLNQSVELLCKAWGFSSLITCFCPIYVGWRLSVVGTPKGVGLWGQGFDPRHEYFFVSLKPRVRFPCWNFSLGLKSILRI